MLSRLLCFYLCFLFALLRYALFQAFPLFESVVLSVRFTSPLLRSIFACLLALIHVTFRFVLRMCYICYVYNSTLGMATFVVIFFGSNLIKHLGWRAGALTTPLMMAVLAAPLFGVVIASKVKKPSRRQIDQPK